MKMDQWLVRKADNILLGLFSTEEVRAMILEGKLSIQDEICKENGYWFYIHERLEMLNQLGIEVPKSKTESDEEITETDALKKEDAIQASSHDFGHRSTESTTLLQRPQNRPIPKSSEGSVCMPKIQVVGPNKSPSPKMLWLILIAVVLVGLMSYLLAVKHEF